MHLICEMEEGLVFTMAPLWGSENNFVDLVLSIHLSMGLRNPIQLVRLQGEHSTC